MFIKTVFPGAIGHPEVAFKDAINSAIEAGFSGYWFNPSIDFIIPREETLELLQSKHMLAMGMELPVQFRSSEEVFLKDLKELERVADYAQFIGIKRTVTWIVPSHSTLTFNENFNLHVNRIRLIANILSKYGISLGLEFQGPKSLRAEANHWFVHSLDGLMALNAAIGCENVGVLMDSWHWQLAGCNAFDFGQFEKGEDIIAVHVNDAPLGISEENQQDLVRRLPGETGVLDIATFLNGIDKIGYNGPIFAEPFVEELSSLSLKDAFITVSKSLDRIQSLRS